MCTTSMWIIMALVIIVIYKFVYKPLLYWDERNVPCEKPIPFFGNIFDVITGKCSNLEVFQRIYQKYQNRRYVGIYSFNIPSLMVIDPDLLKTIYTKDFSSFPEHKGFLPEDVDPLWNKSLLAIRGGRSWQRLRATLSPAFTSSKMKAMFVLIKETSQQYVSYLKSQGNEVVEVQLNDLFERFTIDVITNVAFGIKTDSLRDRHNTFYTMGTKLAKMTGVKGFILFNAFPSALCKLIRVPVFSKEIREFFTTIVKEAIELREKCNIIRPDVLHLLLQSRKGQIKVEEEIKDIPDGGFAVVEESGYDQGIEQIKMTDEMITAQALIFFLAGFETISMLLSHTIYELVINPDIQQKLRKELEETLLKSQGKLTYDSVMKMQYLDMIISETLRKWPPFVISDRKSTKPYIINAKHPGESDVHVEKGSIIFIPTYCIHMDPNNFPNPDKYDPERFSPENRKKIKECTYIPFGFGPRNCIGSRFALMEAKLALVEIIENFEIVRISKSQIPLVVGKRSYNLVPDCGFWVGLKPR